MAQLVCELYVRLKAVDLARNYELEIPLTQPVIADVLGISLVHVSRSLRELRAEGFLTWQGRTVKIVDWDQLAAFAQFDPLYLSLQREPR